MRKFRFWVANYWRIDTIFVVALVFLLGLIFYKIGVLPNGYSAQEFNIHNNLINHTYTISYLWHNVIFLPYNFGLFIIQQLHFNSLIAIRSVSAFFGVTGGLIFFYLIYKWYGSLIATLSSLIFVSSLWFLQDSRNLGPVILYVLSSLILLIFGLVLRNRKEHKVITILAGLILLLLIYIPGVIWYILILAILQRKTISRGLKNIPSYIKLLLPIVAIIILVPLFYAIARNNELLKTVLGLPSSISIHTILHNLYIWPLNIFIRNQMISIYKIGHLPYLSIFTDVMVVLGIYWAWLNRKLDRVGLLLVALIISWLLYSLGGPVPAVIAMPYIFALAATGIYFLLKQWFTVFPRNPLARGVGVGLLIITVISVGWFQANQYFVVWPNTPSVTRVYSLHE